MAIPIGKISVGLLMSIENFDSWAIDVEAYMTNKDFWQWTTKEPKSGATVEISTDQKAMSELISLIDASLYSFISKATTTKGVWDSLMEAFHKDGTCQRFFTLQKFVSAKAENYDSMHEYVNDMLQLYSKVTTAGFGIDDRTAGSLLLAGLPTEYKLMILGIENSKTDITVDYVKNLLLQNVLFGGKDEPPINRKSTNKKKVKCSECGGDHFRNKCPQLKQNNKNEIDKVLLCLGSKVGIGRRNQSTEMKQIVELMIEESDKVWLESQNQLIFDTNFLGAGSLWTYDEDTWYIDSGASSHMTNDESAVNNVVKCKKESVFAADGNKMNIIGKGDVHKILADGRELIIKNVQVIPSICANLLSVSQIVMNSENEVKFDKNGCRITNGKGHLIASGRLDNGMFKLNLDVKRAYATETSADFRLWHKRLGHIGFEDMQFLNMAIPIGLKCKICIKGKQSRKPYNVTGNRAENKLEIIHTDVCGPLPVQSIGGNRYFVTFIDDSTRKVFLYVMRNKSQVFNCFKDFKVLVEDQSECKIKILRSDNGKEYVNRHFYEFCQMHGIDQQRSPHYAPQQNGLAERMNRTLLDRVRCMLLDSGVSRGFWAEAIQYASRITNSVPSNGTGTKSPEELWSGTIPDINMLKVFGCAAHLSDQKRKKLDDKGIECTFIGLARDVKAYRLYCKQNKKIIISCDVQFLENDFNFDHFSNIDSKSDQFFVEIQDIGVTGRIVSVNENPPRVLNSGNKNVSPIFDNDATTSTNNTNRAISIDESGTSDRRVI